MRTRVGTRQTDRHILLLGQTADTVIIISVFVFHIECFFQNHLTNFFVFFCLCFAYRTFVGKDGGSLDARERLTETVSLNIHEGSRSCCF